MERLRILFTPKPWGTAHFGVLIGIYGRTVGTVLTAEIATVATVVVRIIVIVTAVALAAVMAAVLSMRHDE